MRPAESCTQTEIRQLDVSVLVYQYVVRFNVSMDETHLVYALNGTRQFCYVKSERKTRNCTFYYINVYRKVQIAQLFYQYSNYLASLSSNIPSFMSNDIRSPPGM